MLIAPGLSAALSVTTLVDFEASTSGTTVTTSILNSGTQGSTFDGWITIVDPDNQTPGTTNSLKIDTAASRNFPGSITVGGSPYSTVGTRGMRATMNANQCIQLDLPSPGNQLSVGFYFRWNGANIDFSPRDLVGLRSDPTGGYQMMQAYDNPSQPIVHIHWQPNGGTGSGPDVNISKGTWYWITMKHVAGGGTSELRVYDGTTLSLVGSSTGAVTGGSTTGVTTIQIGIIRYAAGGTQTADYDNFVIDSSGSFPLLPTANIAPTVTTTTATSIGTTTASSGGNVTSDGGDAVTVRGVCRSLSSNPTTSDTCTSNGTGTGSFSSSLTGMSAATLYHIRAYATNGVGTSYGSDLTFTTLSAATPRTSNFGNITMTGKVQ